MNLASEAERSYISQEKWRQKQVSIMYRNGRPIFSPQVKIPSIRLFKDKYKNDLNIFEHQSMLTRKNHDKDFKYVK